MHLGALDVGGTGSPLARHIARTGHGAPESPPVLPPPLPSCSPPIG
ncbi:hypothetical protein [Streptomyces hirsutus]